MYFPLLKLLKLLSIFYRHTLYAIDASTSSSSLTTQSTTSVTMNTTKIAAPAQTPKHPLHEPHICHDGVCRNGGTCHRLQLPGGALPSCHCPLHFSGTFCENGKLGIFCCVLILESVILDVISIYVTHRHTHKQRKA